MWFEGSDEGIVDFIESLGSSPDDVKSIILTHGHPDHVGSLPELIDITEAQIFIHEMDISLLERFTGLKKESIRNLSILKGNENIDLLGETQVIHSPGHTDGSILLYNRSRKILFTGDVLITNSNGGLSLPKQEYTKDMEMEKESVKRLARLDFDVLLPGHGPPIIENAKSKVLRFIKEVISQVTV